MGCSSSKVDDLPAVTLCRERCLFLEEAIKQRYDFADSHVAYTQSLKEIGISLERFFNQDLHGYTTSSPLLSLPTQRKGGGDSVAAAATATATATAVVVEPSSSQSPSAVTYNHNHSNSGSHLHFHSEDEDSDDDDDESLHHSENLSPLNYNHDNNGTLGSGYTVNYMRNRTTQSVVYEQRPMSPNTVNYATAGPSSSSNSAYYPYSYPNQENPPPGSSYPPYYNNYPPAYSNYGYYGQPPYGSSPPQPPPAAAAASSSKPPPPPPSPPRASAWDFLNPFETFEKYYPPTTPSRDSKEVREEEGIPELEDENYQQEVVKEVHGEHKKFSVGGGDNYSKMVADEGERKKSVEALYQTRPSVSAEKEEKEYEVHLVDKNVMAKEQRSQDQGNVAAFKPRGGLRGVNDVVTEIRTQFERASESGNEILKILEAGKIPYHRKSAVHQVSSKMLHSITPSLSVVSSQPSTSKSAESSSSIEKIGSDYLDFEEDARMGSVNLSSTLQKLYIWEKKLYAEVKAEEKMRVEHERKSRRLKRLVERGAEAQKLESTRTLVRTLSTKIRIAIQIVDRMSIKINKLRDEELWPQIMELLGGLVRMWTAMLVCHQNQCQAMAEAKNLDAIASNRKLSDANLEATLQLELELLNWILSFSRWISAQKGYIKALNGWLLKCILYEPEETSDGIRPFSPSSIGAPPVFVICNQWSQAMERISDKEVLDAMKVFAMSVFQLWEQHNLEMRHRMTANKDMERQVKALEREEHKMQKAVQAMDKQLVLVSGQSVGLPMPGHIVSQSGTTNSSLQSGQSGTTNSSLQSGLKMIFEAMERFTANSKQAFDDLRIRTEEVIREENAKVS